MRVCHRTREISDPCATKGECDARRKTKNGAVMPAKWPDSSVFRYTELESASQFVRMHFSAYFAPGMAKISPETAGFSPWKQT